MFLTSAGSCVVVSKSRHTRLPELPFRSFVRDDVILPEEPHKNSGKGGGGGPGSGSGAGGALNHLKRETLSLDEAAGSAGSNGRRLLERIHPPLYERSWQICLKMIHLK